MKLGGACLALLFSSSVWMNEKELTSWLKIEHGFSVGRNRYRNDCKIGKG